MSTTKEFLHDAMSKLKQQRDEIRLKIHLGEMEAKEEWDRLERKYLGLKDQYDSAVDAAEETAEDVWEDMKKVAHDLKEGFSKVWKAL